MSDDDNKIKDFSIFEKNYANDPFREEFLVFEHQEEGNKEEKTFKINIEKRKNADKTQEKQETVSKSPEKKEAKKENKEKGLKQVLKDSFRQIIATIIVLILGFFILNWSAYYQITKNNISKWLGTKEQSPLEMFVEEKIITQNGEDILLMKNAQMEKNELIPPLDIEISPISNRIIIPRIDKNVPVVNVSSENLLKKDWGALEKEMQEALKNGVVHYPGTGIPGTGKNTVITGHSSYFPWDSGRFKDVFALLHDVVLGDKIVIYHNQKKYVYEVSEVKIVLPNDLEVLKQDTGERLTLLTCTPIGTNLKRLIIIAEPSNNNARITDKVSR